MRCLVTGGLGFIGSHLVDRLKKLGHYVVVVDDLSNPAIENRQDAATDQIHICDVASAIPWLKYDWVFQLAAISRTCWAISSPDDCTHVNVLGSLNVLEDARQQFPQLSVP